MRAGLIAFECQALATFTGYDALLDGSLEEAPVQLRDPTRPAIFFPYIQTNSIQKRDPHHDAF